MKPDILDRHARTDWSPLTRAIALPLVLVVAVGLVAVLANGSKDKVTSQRRATERVLYVGDSLSVGKFGELIGNYLVKINGRENVALYASCGSSPENWLRDEPTYQTRCGYRELTLDRSVVGDPLRHNTPKVEDLIARYHPSTVIVQLGTNWMDRLSANPAKEAEIRSYLRRFVAHIRPVRHLVWITPPDSSRYSSRVQNTVAELIKDATDGGDKFYTIDSRRMTKYVRGRTGGDGVHYRSEAATDWANQVIVRLKRKYGWGGLAY